MRGLAEGQLELKAPFSALRARSLLPLALHLKLPIHSGTVILANSNKTTCVEGEPSQGCNDLPVYASGERPNARFMAERSLLGVITIESWM